MKRSIIFMWFLIPLLVALVAPSKGHALLIQNDLLYTNDVAFLGGALLAELDVVVYEPGDIYDGGFDVALGSDDYLYVYTITNRDSSPYTMQIKTFFLDLNKDAPVSQLGAELPGVQPKNDLDLDDIYFYYLNLAEGLSTSVYVVSSAAPELVEATFLASIGGSSDTAPRVWAPDPVENHGLPEPATLILIGSGLVGLAAFRRKMRKHQ